jgi:hypothetical protein
MECVKRLRRNWLGALDDFRNWLTTKPLDG